MFRFEIWVHKDAPEDKRKELIEYLKVEMQCELIEVKNIEVK